MLLKLRPLFVALHGRLLLNTRIRRLHEVNVHRFSSISTSLLLRSHYYHSVRSLNFGFRFGSLNVLSKLVTTGKTTSSGGFILMTTILAPFHRLFCADIVYYLSFRPLFLRLSLHSLFLHEVFVGIVDRLILTQICKGVLFRLTRDATIIF